MGTTPKIAGHKLATIATPVAWQRGHALCTLWPYISKTQKSIKFKICTCLHDVVLVTLLNYGESRSKISVTRAYNL